MYISETSSNKTKKTKTKIEKKTPTHTHTIQHNTTKYNTIIKTYTNCIGVVYITPSKAVTCNFSKLGCSMHWLVYCKHPPDIMHAVLQRTRFESGFSYRAKSKEKKNNRKRIK